VFETLISRGFEILALHHAEAILIHDMRDAISELETVLDNIELPVEELVRGGGGEGQLTQRMRRALTEYGWEKHNFEIKKIVDGEEKESTSHEIDHVKYFDLGVIAVELEWNNKDPFYDRDLENFKRLHADGVISVGGIITRGSSLQHDLRDAIAQFARNRGISNSSALNEYYDPTRRQLQNIEKAVRTAGNFEEGWARAFVADKYGEATTHWRKLLDRVHRGVGNPCPLLLIGIPVSVLTY